MRQYHDRSIQHSQLIQEAFHVVHLRSIWQRRALANRIADGICVVLYKTPVFLRGYIRPQHLIARIVHIQEIAHEDTHACRVVG